MAEAMRIEGSDVGRLGHARYAADRMAVTGGVGHTVITANMVITLELRIAIDGGGIMVTEENIVIRDGAPNG